MVMIFSVALNYHVAVIISIMAPCPSHAPCANPPRYVRNARPPGRLPRQTLVSFALAFLALIAANTLVRASSLPVDDGFVLREWYVEDGLPHNVVNAVVRDKRGFLWIATVGGLARFDGRQFVDYKVPQEYMQNGYTDNIRAMCMENEHTLLLITDADRLVRLHDGKFELHPADAMLRGHILRDLAVDSSGAVWIGTNTSTLLRWDEKSLQTFNAGSGLPARGGRYCVVTDSDNRTWVGVDDFLGWYESGRMHRYEGDHGHAIIIAPARSGGIWISAREHLAKIEGGQLKVVLPRDKWLAPGMGIREIFEAGDGALWIATRRDFVFRLAKGIMERVPLHIERVRSITDDIDSNVWMGTYGGGLVRATLRHHVLLNAESGLPTNVSIAVCEDEHGAIWCANQAGGLVRVKDGRINTVSLDKQQAPYISNVCPDRKGRIWACSPGALLWTTAAGETDPLTGETRWVFRRSEIPMRTVQTMFCAANGDLWLSWDYGRLGVMHDGKMREYGKAEGFPGERVAGIIERKDGTIWFGTEPGRLFRLDKNSDAFVEEKLPDSARAPRLFSLFADSADRLWLGTTNGLLLWRGKQSRLFTRADGLSDRLINQIIEDEHERLWISSRRGIFYVSIKQLLEIANAPEGSAPKATATLYGRDESLDGISGISGGQPMAWKSRDDRIWFATYRGVVGFDTPEVGESRKTVPVYIDGIRTNDSAMETIKPGAPARIAPNSAPIEFHFTALNFSTPQRTRVRRMLEGVDTGWIDVGNERSVTYPRLPPGRYVFRVQADDADSGVMNQSEASVDIIVAAAWWQTAWAALGTIILFAVVVALIVRRVSNRILRRRLRRLQRERALDHERARIARDLHDELGGSMTKIGFVADKLQRRNADPSQTALLGRLVGLSTSLVEDLHKIIWTVNPQNDCWQNLAAYIARYAQRHLADTGVMCTVDGVESIPSRPLTPEVQHHLLALTKEALNNILKHSQADRVRIVLSATTERFHMSISDNGRGFDTTLSNPGNGLENMRARMSEIDGHISITSRPGEGAKIEIDAPFHCKQPLIN